MGLGLCRKTESIMSIKPTASRPPSPGSKDASDRSRTACPNDELASLAQVKTGSWPLVSLTLAGLPCVLGLVGWPLLGSDFDSVTSKFVDELLLMKRQMTVPLQSLGGG